jgi:hypothetical protein
VATLINPARLREYFSIASDIKDERLTPHIGTASRRIRKWVGEAAYTDALSETPADVDRKDDLKNAEAQLAMHFAVPGLNTKQTVNGVAKTIKEGGAMAGNVVFSYLTPTEIKQLAQIYFDVAEEIARLYMLSDGTPEAEFTVVSEE